MKNDLTCEVVQDLLPSYVDHLTSDVTNTAIETHIASVPTVAGYFRYADSGTRAGRNGNGCFNYRLFKKEQQKEQTPDSCRHPDRDTVARQHLGISDVFLPCTAEKYRTDRLCGYRKRQ